MQYFSTRAVIIDIQRVQVPYLFYIMSRKILYKKNCNFAYVIIAGYSCCIPLFIDKYTTTDSFVLVA